MKYTIEWSEVKKTGTTNGKDWKITNMTLKDESGQTTSDVSTFDPVTTGGTLEGEIVTNEKGYKNFKNHIQRPSNPIFNKTAAVEKAMDTKAKNIEAAQDRSAWMWAKNNASMLLANDPEFYKDMLPGRSEMMAKAVIQLATLIYNGEPVGAKDKLLDF